MNRLVIITVLACLLAANSYGQLTVRNSANQIKMSVTQDGNVGIGVTEPAAKLDVNGRTKTVTVQITGGSPGASKVLTSDADGLGHWQPLTSIQHQFLVNQYASFDPNPISLLNATLVPLGNTEITVPATATYLIIGTVDLEVTYATAAGVLQHYTGGGWNSIDGSIILANNNTVDFIRSTCTRTWVLNMQAGDKVRLAAHNWYSSGTAKVYRVHSCISVMSLY